MNLAERAPAEFSFLGKNVNIFAVELPLSDDGTVVKGDGSIKKAKVRADEFQTLEG